MAHFGPKKNFEKNEKFYHNKFSIEKTFCEHYGLNRFFHFFMNFIFQTLDFKTQNLYVHF
jgi:hypothetical protein